eukprot:CAMPEP_0205829962 /NCGR_PEP_ID=MMETSP0206-20130828/39749_1 /ASSEMBLY_ACC=CAM_ASM_000279 /TAXON_ID=36767 /ORGANISM="Euplotes focardii, Strain TN1" /LENGTH=92 /DNA_ID=CAMNT_0053133169 /DNA_START=228 /DNA_END=503 /DNA_ORIENTATION=+
MSLAFETDLSVKVYLGDAVAARDRALLSDNNVTHIVNCAKEIPNYHEELHADGPPAFEYLNVYTLCDYTKDDLGKAELLTAFETVRQFVSGV